MIRALSFPQAAALFRSRLQPLAESDPEIPINLNEVKLTCSFVAEVTATFKAVRTRPPRHLPMSARVNGAAARPPARP